MGGGGGPIVALLINVIVEAAFIAIQIERNRKKAEEEAAALAASAANHSPTAESLITTAAGQEQVFNQLVVNAKAALDTIVVSILDINYDAKVELAGHTGHVAETGSTGIVGAVLNVLPKKMWRDGIARPKPDEFTFYDYIDYYVWRYWYDYYERFEENGFGTEPNKEETKKDVIALEQRILNNIAEIYVDCKYNWEKSEFEFKKDGNPTHSAFHNNRTYEIPPEKGENGRLYFSRFQGLLDLISRSRYFNASVQPIIPPGAVGLNLVLNPCGETDIRLTAFEYVSTGGWPDGTFFGTLAYPFPTYISGDHDKLTYADNRGYFMDKGETFMGTTTLFNPGATYKTFWKNDQSDEGYWANIYALRVMVNGLIVEAISDAKWGKQPGKAYLVSDYAKKTLWETVGDKPKVYGTIQNNYTEDLFYKTYVARKMLEALIDLGQLQAVDTGKNVMALSEKLWKIDPHYTDKISPAYGVAPGQTGISRETELAAGECWLKAGKMVQDIYKEEIKLVCEEWKAKNYELTDHSVVIRKLTHHFTPPTVDEPKPPQDPSPTKPGDKRPGMPSDRPLVPTQEQIEEEAPAQVGEAPKPIQDTSVIKHIRQATVNQAKAAPLTERQKRLNAISERFRNKLNGSGIEMSAQEQADAEREDKNHDGLDTFPEEDEDADIAPEADAEDEEEVAAQTAVMDTSIKKAVRQQVSTQVKAPPLSEKQKRINAIAARFQEKK
jgi:hypothetical protein